jgi:hypothetical protein
MGLRWDTAVRSSFHSWLLAAWCGAALLVCSTQAADEVALPDNLARSAVAAATSEHNASYLAKFATDGKIPPQGSAAEDLSAAWCVLKAKTGDAADFTLGWNQPVDVAEIVYFGRTSWFMEECFKDFEVYLDDATQPAAKGTLEMIHGPQRIAVSPAKARKITIKFLNSYGGMNPGAAEIMVFGQTLSRKQAALLHRLSGILEIAGVDQVSPDALREMIVWLQQTHGPAYPAADSHLARLAAVGPQEDDDAQQELAGLQRDVLLFDLDRVLVIKRHEINASHVYTYHYEGQQNGGGLYVVRAHEPDAPPVELVASPDGQILDCDLSYDGTQVLFSWRLKTGDGYHLWTVNIDGSGLKQLTDGPWHDYNGCWLPDGGIAFLSTRAPQFAYCWHAPVGILHRMAADGSNVVRLSANYLNDFTPAVLEDGRLIYTRWEYVDRPAIPIQSLWTINPDGTGMAGYFGNRVLSPGTFMEARQIPGTTKIICTMTGHNGPTRGAIGVVDRSRGVNAQEAIENLTPDTPVPAVDKGNGNTDGSKSYSGPMPLDAKRFLVSARGPILVRDLAGTCASLALARPADGMQYFCATPVRPRMRPPAIPSRLPADAAGQAPLATLYLQDVYAGLEPAVQRGEVKSIRVVRELQKTVRIDPSLRAFGFQFPVISCGATYAGKDVIGEVDVNPDGSAYFQVPSGVPLYFMALDKDGKAVQRMRSFTHLMPGEVQGCVGCHESRLDSPLRHVAGLGMEPKTLQPPEWGSGGFDYSRIVQPVLDQHCVQCHHPHDPTNDLDLTGDKTDWFNVSYDVLARERQGGRGTSYVNWIPTYNGQEWNILQVAPKTWGSPQSKLADLVLSGHPDAAGNPQIELNDAERRRILAWIDLNVPYYGSSETAHPNAPGCRQMYPTALDPVLADVGKRRCAECHRDGAFPRREWTRVTNPQLNAFLLAPLARTAGGTERCGKIVFPDTSDPDYQAILATFAPVLELLAKTPRMDMPGAQPSCEVNRSCQ